MFRDVLVTLGASGRGNVGPDEVQQVLIAAWSLVEPHRHHSQPSKLAMFAPSFARVARSTTNLSTIPASPLCRAAFSTASKSLHQRRYSSSKSSIPPSNKKKPVEDLEQNAPTQLQGSKKDAESKDDVTKIPVASSTDNVPHAPPTTHLHEDGT